MLSKIGLDTVQTVDARRVWEYLDRPWSNFSHWFNKSIDHCQLIENVDYVRVLVEKLQNSNIGRPLIDYALSLDAAKEVVMIDRGELGKAARVYFITAERRLRRGVPLTDNELMARAFLVAHKTIDDLTHKVKELEPKAKALDTLSAAEGTRCVTEAWKELGLPGKRTRRQFFLYLQSLGWIFRRRDRNYEGYADAIKRGLIDNEMVSYVDPNDDITKTRIEVKITSKGMTKLAGLLGKKPRLVPMPFGVWHALASVAEMLPERPITRNQVELMQLDNLTSPDAPGFGDLRISSTSLEDTLPSIVGPSGGLPRVPPVP